jgi:hypothetical protein
VWMPVRLVGHVRRGWRADEATAPSSGESGGV